MTIIRSHQFEQLIAGKAQLPSAILFYGSDGSGIRDRAKQLAKKYLADESFEGTPQVLNDRALRDDPDLLITEYRSIPMFGGKRILWVEEAGLGLEKSIPACLLDVQPDTLILAEAGALKKTSKLRQYFETAKSALVLPCYEESQASSAELIRQTLAENGLKISQAAGQTLLYRFGNDRLTMRQELEKLVCYCYGQESVSLEHVNALNIGETDTDISDLCHQVGHGNTGDVLKNLDLLRSSGQSGTAMLIALERHFGVLLRLRIEIEAGASANLAVKSARPPIFFKDAPKFEQQIRRWSYSNLTTACAVIAKTQKRLRSNSPDETLDAERAVLEISAMAN